MYAFLYLDPEQVKIRWSGMRDYFIRVHKQNLGCDVEQLTLREESLMFLLDPSKVSVREIR